MTLHLFNPEHDLALAANLSNFTSPHAGRQLRADLGYLPAIWAAKDDCVLVDNAEEAQTAFSRLMHKNFPNFVEKHQLARLDISRVEPWGWDLALRSFLLRYGVAAELCPSEEKIAVIRDLSHRKTAVELLGELIDGEIWKVKCGRRIFQPQMVSQLSTVNSQLSIANCQHVLKSPWSSSGRGVRFIDGAINDQQARWVQNVIERQGSIIVEPYYNKVKDFAMEFESDGCGNVTCLGLSLFHTSNGAYMGNILASEEEKQEMINRYVPVDVLENTQQDISRILGRVFDGKYQGPFGVDMMVVAREDKDGFVLHPCVEINLRRTMGHVALELSKVCPSDQVMKIEYTDNHYKLKIRK
jgi:hypothetical protein